MEDSPFQSANQPTPAPDFNPYQPALAGAPGDALPTIFSAKAVGVATFFGSGVAGTILLYLSLSRLGLKRDAQRGVALGAALTVATLAVVLVLPPGTANFVPLVATLVMSALGRKLLDAPVAAHLARGGQCASGWHTAGITLGGAVLAVCILFAANTAVAGVGQKFVETSPGHHVIYKRKATQADARAVGKVLEAHGVFAPGKIGEVLIRGSENELVVQVVLSGNWSDTEVVTFYTNLAKELSKATGKRFVDVLLCDDLLKTRQKISVANAS